MIEDEVTVDKWVGGCERGDSSVMEEDDPFQHCAALPHHHLRLI